MMSGTCGRTDRRSEKSASALFQAGARPAADDRGSSVGNAWAGNVWAARLDRVGWVRGRSQRCFRLRELIRFAKFDGRRKNTYLESRRATNCIAAAIDRLVNCAARRQPP